ncbi:MAG: ABC transporter substrate-binding protein [Verrucomicrobia bacterium]|nr:ABC transporter substrate-binding protein [Verrucomicrobiota bacterium]
MHRILTTIGLLAAVLLALGSGACRRETPPPARQLQFDAFVPIYNRFIRDWLLKQQAAATAEAAAIQTKLAAAQGDAKAILEAQAEAARRELEKYAFRLSLGDYFKFATPADLPADLGWETGMDEPEIGDPRASKGGTLRRFILTFPSTIRPFGDNSNNSFRGELYDYITLSLVGMHPETLKPIPGVASAWAVAPDGRTTYFRLNPAATYSDGVPVKARDFLISVYVRASDNVFDPYYKQYYREELAQFTVYDDHTLAITLPERKMIAALIAGGNTPSPPHFYADYGPDYSERYQWRFPPTTGAYEVFPKDIVKGVSITQTRVRNWWARDLKYYRYRFNPDHLVNTVVRDEAKAFELFRAGELDTFYMTLPAHWYEKSEMPPVYAGHIERTTFYKRYPKIPRGFYLNVRRPPLDDRNVRLGIHFASNWQKVINVIFRGDNQRLNAYNEGYPVFSDPSLKARPYSIDRARAAFRAAGYTVEGADGILNKPDGTRLSTAVTYQSEPVFDRIFAILREDAKACGLDLRLDGLESTVAYQKEMQKQYDISFSGWDAPPPVPDFHQALHSANAFDAKGNVKTQTNNLFNWARPDTDRLCDIVRLGRTEEEIREASWQLQHIIHDEGIFVPSYTADFIRLGSWRWICWPDCETTRFSPPMVYDPHEVHVLWIDEDRRLETLAAINTGKSFGEVNRVADAYRIQAPAAATPDEAKPADP